MIPVTMLPVASSEGAIEYFAISGQRQSHGRTAGEALDSLTTNLPPDEFPTLAIVQPYRPDEYFPATQHRRLQELMERWRSRGSGLPLSVAEQAELESLIAAEVEAAGPPDHSRNQRPTDSMICPNSIGRGPAQDCRNRRSRDACEEQYVRPDGAKASSVPVGVDSTHTDYERAAELTDVLHDPSVIFSRVLQSLPGQRL
jgi:hypothetical protein